MKLKQWQNIFSVTVNANSLVQHVIQITNGIMKHINLSVKVIVSENEIIVGVLAHVFVKIITDISVIDWDEIIFVVDIVSTKKTNTIATNVTSTAWINCQSKKVRDCYILHTILSTIILLLIITVICYYYVKQKHNMKWKIMN